jgi:selenium metabolism protein YedF
MKIINCEGLKCPQPVINTKKYFETIESGNAEVVVDNEVAKINVSKFCQSNNLKYSVEETDGLYHIKIAKELVGGEIINEAVQVMNNSEIISNSDKALVILITSDKLGTGDETLGATLMKSYLYALSESDKIPKDLLFLNSGVKLVAEGSEVLDSLNKLKDRGVNIASCGVCLDFYELKEKLAVGEITNMYTIIEKMNSANNTIKL